MKLKKNKTPMRRCAGCMESKPKQELIRIAFYEEKLTVDLCGRAKGRGMYLCRNEECRAKAKKKNALQRNFEANIPRDEIDRVFEELKQIDEQK